MVTLYQCEFCPLRITASEMAAYEDLDIGVCCITCGAKYKVLCDRRQSGVRKIGRSEPASKIAS